MIILIKKQERQKESLQLENTLELQHVIYNFLDAQIKFGVYGLGTSLPAIEEMSRLFSVSQDTVRFAYRRLKQEGSITLTKKAGAVVVVQYTGKEIEQHIYAFFAPRQSAVTDLCRSQKPLFTRAQWFAMKNASPKRLDELESLCLQKDVPPVLTLTRHLYLIYSTLNNDLLLRLVWHAYMFFQAPFFSLPQNCNAFKDGNAPLLHMIDLCRRKDWDALMRTMENFQAQLSSAIADFYKKQIPDGFAGQPVPFHWNAYQKPSQRCYSLAMKFLISIGKGTYAEGSFLPAPAKLAEAEHVSVNTIRRTLALLNKLGATKSVNGIGTKVLNAENSAKNCDFFDSVIQKRLLDFVQSLHILVLTCHSAAEITFSSLSAADIQQIAHSVSDVKRINRHELIVFILLQLLSRFSPVQAVREVYSQLLQILFWGFPLRGIHGTREAVNAFYLPYIDAFAGYLERSDSAGASALLEDLILHKFKFAAGLLDELGIHNSSCFEIPYLIPKKP